MSEVELLVRSLSLSKCRLYLSTEVMVPELVEGLGFTLTGYFCKVDFVIDENGIVKLIPLNIPIQKLSGILHRKGMKPKTLEEIEEIIGEAASDWT